MPRSVDSYNAYFWGIRSSVGIFALPFRPLQKEIFGNLDIIVSSPYSFGWLVDLEFKVQSTAKVTKRWEIP